MARSAASRTTFRTSLRNSRRDRITTPIDSLASLPTSQPLRPPPLPGDDRWRRQLIGALHDVDDGTPTAPDGLPPVAPYTRAVPAAGRRDQRDDVQVREVRHRRPPTDADALSSLVPGWCTTRRVLAAAVATTCVFSTGVLWATHRSESAAEYQRSGDRGGDRDPGALDRWKRAARPPDPQYASSDPRRRDAARLPRGSWPAARARDRR